MVAVFGRMNIRGSVGNCMANRSLRPNREENKTESLGDRREGLSSAEIIIYKEEKEKPAHTGMRP